MTRPRRRRSLRGTVGVIGSVSALTFAVLFGGLSQQMAASKDPALGPKARALAAALNQPPKRRIVRRTVTIRKVHESGPAASAPPAQVQAPPTAAPVAPAPAPPPAPVVTSVS